MASEQDEEPSNIPQEQLQEASKYAAYIGDMLSQDSKILNPALEASIPRFERDEIVLGELLGSGGFNNVFEVGKIDLFQDITWFSEHQQETRRIVSQKAINSKYAIKFLKKETMEIKGDYKFGAADLVAETKYLSSLTAWPHPNIIQLHGVSADGVDGFGHCVEGGYFLIIDRLRETLDRRLTLWQEVQSRIHTRKDPKLSRKLLRAAFLTRLRVAVDLASAVKHLHSLGIMYRDLKPDNVGFDSNGTVKLFDFGLAKELIPKQRIDNDTYEMTGDTGSRRYMAPEVALSKPYNKSADVYSFGMLLWQICSLEEPFEYMSFENHLKYVVKGDQRPRIDSTWPSKLQRILSWSWSPDLDGRPEMRDVHQYLKREVQSFDLNKANSLSNIKSRSVSPRDVRKVRHFTAEVRI
mmetsp:Transcript_3987/g.6078  ORF Transcript_3987/g.6078 Transcript_3987/m.6078 type:complete len:410 (+) Transcript_3987:92-1321(+)|eukprot:CAMPEP_0195302692 /NCGR_PEP_ID=MMETSP0707-20130614/31525_1 /TAXON_ID=33640 /ORGANISM="Asterionellopsis glacialis, Strain CCMP134" /LENGTH=409 /DNA_ID=CAMNT_0040366019 /DNA_START=81 /DNA_END=1310 /DNA_ORIENTATION=-